jgi:hypothetical protein
MTMPAPAGIDAAEYRSFDGSGNNLDHPEWGSAGTPLRRLAAADYADGIAAPAGPDRVAPRILSNELCAQHESRPNHAGGSSLLWQWGQFLDHDIDLTPAGETAEPVPIQVPAGDPHFDPGWTGVQTITFQRSAYDPASGTGRDNPRQQTNIITAFIDASNVYGSGPARAQALRTMDGTGRLATSHGDQFLPYNDEGLPNAGGSAPRLFLAGDVRANEQVALTAMHTLFVREHNRLCREIRIRRPELTGDETYQRARKIVGAMMQVITYREFLPMLLGSDGLESYAGYDPDTDPGVSNEFSTAAYRVGHSMLSPEFLRVNMPGRELVSTSLRDAFFNPLLIHKGGGLAPILRGLTVQPAQEVDGKIVDGVRNFLFGEPGSGGFDLASLNIQRGRDHGLADYNRTRRALGLPPAGSFADLTSDPALQARLLEVLGDVEDMDLWVGGLAEDHVPGAMVGETFHAILVDQFTRLRDGDRFWYRNDPFFLDHPALLEEVENTLLSDVIRRNTRIGDEIADDVFRMTEGL